MQYSIVVVVAYCFLSLLKGKLSILVSLDVYLKLCEPTQLHKEITTTI